MNTDQCTDLVQCPICWEYYYPSTAVHNCKQSGLLGAKPVYYPDQTSYSSKSMSDKLDRIIQLLEELLGRIK